MLSQQHQRLAVDCHPTTTPIQHTLLGLPLHSQVFPFGIHLPSTLEHQPGVRHPQGSKYPKEQITKGWREYAASRILESSSQRTAKEGCQGSTMSSAASSASARSRIIFRAHPTSNNDFTFQVSPQPTMHLSFPPRPSPPRPGKRCRARTDIDGEYSCVYKKKRRLRLFLITSRLSPHYSSPATNIVNRGNSKIAVWAKQKALGRNLLRKAAILNNIRRLSVQTTGMNMGWGRSLASQEREQKQLELARLAFIYGSHDTHTRPVLQRTPAVAPATAVRTGDHFELSGDMSSGSSSPTSSRSVSPCDAGGDEEAIYQSPNDAYSYSPPRAQIPRRSYIPLPPSPLGLSNYDAFDSEEDIPDPYAHLDDEDEPFEQEMEEEELDSYPYPLSDDTPAPYTPAHQAGLSGSTDARTTPPQTIYSDFSILDPGEPVMGDYDQVDAGADPVWPSAFASEPTPLLPASSSPNFTALFATSNDGLPLRTQLEPSPASHSPNFGAVTTPIDDPTQRPSPASWSPNFSALPATTVEDVPSLTAIRSTSSSCSPNFMALSATSIEDAILQSQWSSSYPSPEDQERKKKEEELEDERERQRSLMFLRLDE